MNCPNCAKPIDPGGRFCQACGTAIMADNAQPAVQQQPAVPRRPGPSPRRGGSRKMGAVAGVAVLALVVGLGLAVWLLRGHIPGLKTANVIEAVPARETKADRWGLIDLDGNFLVSNEWENAPSIPSDGIVRVRTRDGRYEFYTAEKKPRQVGESYKAASLFGDGLAAVVRDKEPVHYIDRTGKVAFEARQIGGHSIERASRFAGGLAVVETDQGKCGYINPKGEFVVKPAYDECMAFVESMALVSTNETVSGTQEKRTLTGFIDRTGAEVIKPRSGIVYLPPSEGLIPYSDGGQEWGVMRADGEKLIKPSSKFRTISWFQQGHAVFSDGTYFGVLNANGEIVVRPKYESAVMAGSLVLVWRGGKAGFIDFEGNEVLPLDFEKVTPFMGDRAFAKEGSRWVLIDRKGKSVSKRDFEEIAFDELLASGMARVGLEPPTFVVSDYFDAGSVAGALPLSDLSSRSFAGVSAFATIDELLPKLGLSESDLPRSQSLKISGRPAGRSSTYSLELYFDRPLRAWLGVGYEHEARCVAVRLEVDLRGKATGRGQMSPSSS